MVKQTKYTKDEIIGIMQFGKKFGLDWKAYYNLDTKRVEVYTNKDGLHKILEGRKYETKPKWVNGTIEAKKKCGQRARDEKPNGYNRTYAGNHRTTSDREVQGREYGHKKPLCSAQSSTHIGAEKRKDKGTQNTTRKRSRCAKT